MTESTIAKKLSGIPPCPVHSPQGKESHMLAQPTSRRAVLAGASALPVATVAIASAIASSPALARGGVTFAPELIARVDSLEQRWRDLSLRDCQRSQAINHAFLGITGMPISTFRELRPADPGYEALAKALDAAASPLEDSADLG